MRPPFAEMTISAIRGWLAQHEEDLEEALLAALMADSRQGVRTLAEKHLSRQETLLLERDRVAALWSLEEEAWRQGYARVVGVDEAGCGPLAGPVVAAAVVFPQTLFISGLNDSKKLTSARREEIFPLIEDKAEAVGVGFASSSEIDAGNILRAAKLAMVRAVAALPKCPDLALVDGNKARMPSFAFPVRTFAGGDGISASIAAASIVAKVVRDRYMAELAGRYPEYGFAKHKGYPTADHYAALARVGPCPEHRRTFLPEKERGVH